MSDEQLIATPGAFGETGNFLLERELGRGGMGGVYMGRDKMLDRPVAVKVMLRQYGDDAEFVEKFKREAQAAARLLHPNISQVYSYGICDGMPYIAMELVAGGSLSSLMENNPPGTLDVTRVLKICEQVAQALRCAADQGVVHGDIKPENILLDANGNAKIVDFGLAAMQKDTDEIWGTPYYIAPEKIKREAVDFRADMYNLGATLYHALTGVTPFDGPDVAAVVKARFVGMPRKPSEVRAGLTPMIDALVMKMLELDKEKRFPSFEALLLEFRRVLTTGLTVQKKPTLKIRRPVVEQAPVEEEEDEDGEESESAARNRRNRKLAGRVKMKKTGRKGRKRFDDEDLGDSDNAGSKIGLVVACVVGAIVVVIGLLVWYKLANDHAKAVSVQQQIERGVNNARNAIGDTRKAAVKYADSMSEISRQVILACEKPTREIAEVVPPEVARLLKLPPTKELLDAIESTNTAAKVESKDEKESEKNGEESAKVERKAKAKSRPAAATPAKPVRVIEEYDPEDPDAKPIEQVKAEADAAAAAEVAAAAEAEKTTAETAAAPEPVVPNDPVIREMNDLWERGYKCQAAVIRINKLIGELLDDIDKALKVTDMTAAAGKQLGAQSLEFLERFNAIKGTPDAEAVLKAQSYITQRGAKAVKTKLNDLRVEELRRKRAEEKAQEAALEAQRQKEREEAHAKLVAAEETAAKEKYASLLGMLKKLSWEPPLLQLSNLQKSSQTAEGKIAVGKELKKVEALKAVQSIMVSNLVNYTFTRAKLAKHKVFEVDMSDIKVLLPDGKKKQSILWTKFYEEYSGNLNELVNRFIVRGQANAGLSKIEWCEAMLGAALTYRVLIDNPAALVRGEQIAKQAIAEFPDYLNVGKAFFPEIDFEAAAAEDDL